MGGASSPEINKRRRLTQTTLDCPAVLDVKARYWSKIVIFAPLRSPRRNNWNDVLPDGEKF